MAAHTIDCGACGSAVPYGRLSCPSCGELLASVAGAARRLTTIAAIAQPSALTAPTAAPTTVAGSGLDLDGAAPAGPVARVLDAEPDPPRAAPSVGSHDVDGSAAMGGSGAQMPPRVLPDGDEMRASRTSWQEEASDESLDRAPGADPEPEDRTALSWPSPTPDGPGIPMPATAAVTSPASGASVGGYAAAPARASLPGPVASLTGQAASIAAPAFPGAYVPPSLPTMSLEADPPAIPAPARAWAGTAARAAADAPDGSGATSRELLSLTDPTKRDEAVGWIAVAGGTIAVLGFLLPWATVLIGSVGTGYLANWGLAGPGHPIVVLGLLVVVALALVGQRVPAWIRLGVPGLLLGGLLIGLLWPYLFGRLGPLPGVYLTTVGALVFIAASAAALVVARHEARSQGV